eukprot:824555-Lingulodinium_polyedra.AAC.1
MSRWDSGIIGRERPTREGDERARRPWAVRRGARCEATRRSPWLLHIFVRARAIESVGRGVRC